MLRVSWCLGVSRRSGVACERMPRQMLAALAGRQAELDQHGRQHGHQCRQRRRLCSLRKSYLSPWRPPSWSVTVTIVMAVVTISIIALGPHTSSYTFPLACEQHSEASPPSSCRWWADEEALRLACVQRGQLCRLIVVLLMSCGLCVLSPCSWCLGVLASCT